MAHQWSQKHHFRVMLTNRFLRVSEAPAHKFNLSVSPQHFYVYMLCMFELRDKNVVQYSKFNVRNF